MAEQDKNGLINKVFSAIGDNTSPTDGKINLGFIVELPPFQWFNYLFNVLFESTKHINEQGIGDWDSDTNYAIGGLCRGLDNKLYESLAGDNIDNTPFSTSPFWSEVFLKESYNPTRVYALGDHIEFNGVEHVSLKTANSNNPLTDGEWWLEKGNLDLGLSTVAHEMTADANYVLTPEQNAHGAIVVTDTIVTLTDARDVLLSNEERVIFAKNETLQTLNFRTAGGAGVLLSPGGFAQLWCDGTDIRQTAPLPPVVAGFTPGALPVIHADGDDGSVINVSLLMSAGVWESIGPTGSGADNIWTALDDLPLNAPWVSVKANMVMSATGASWVLGECFKRAYGSSLPATIVNQCATARSYSATSGTITAESLTYDIKIPLDPANRFETTWTSARSSSAVATGDVVQFFVTGFGLITE